jgi:hypothetical protein
MLTLPRTTIAIALLLAPMLIGTIIGARATGLEDFVDGCKDADCVAQGRAAYCAHEFATETPAQRADYSRCLKWAKEPKRALTTRAARGAEIPKQYRGEWCQTKWQTIFKRCKTGDALTVLRQVWGVDDEGCELVSIRKSKYGGHRLFGTCRRTDPGPGDHDYRTEQRWWLGSNGTRLQVIETVPPNQGEIISNCVGDGQPNPKGLEICE